MQQSDVIQVIRDAAAQSGVPFNILLAQARHESGLNPTAVGDSGDSIGLFQIQPKWWYRWASNRGWDIRTPQGNAMAAAHILAGYRHSEGSWVNALRRYNGGPNYQHISMTATYAQKVMELAGKESAGVVPIVGSFRVSAKYGQTGKHWKHTHTGIDLAAARGTPAVAFEGAVVVRTGHDNSYGNYVVLRSIADPRRELFYGHLDSVAVGVGEKVHASEVVGKVGMTGNATGPHLHFEVRVAGKSIDPAPFLKGAGKTNPSEVHTGEQEPLDVHTAASSFAAAIKKYLDLQGVQMDESSIMKNLLSFVPQQEQEATPDQTQQPGTEPLTPKGPVAPGAGVEPSFTPLAGPLETVNRLVGSNG